MILPPQSLMGPADESVVSRAIAASEFDLKYRECVDRESAYEIILQIIDHGYVQGRPALGFEIVDVTSVQTAMRYFNSFYTGVYVYDQNHDAVKYGDLILSVNGIEPCSVAELQGMVADMRVGDTLELVVYRNREKVTVTVTITEQKPEKSQASS